MLNMSNNNYGKILKKTLAGILAGVFLSTSTISWAQEENVNNNKLAASLRTTSSDFKELYRAVAICDFIERDGSLNGIAGISDKLQAVKNGFNNIHFSVISPHEVIIEIPDEGLAVRYFDPAKANVVAPYSDISRLSTKSIGKLSRQIIHRIKALPAQAQDSPTNRKIGDVAKSDAPLTVAVPRPQADSLKTDESSSIVAAKSDDADKETDADYLCTRLLEELRRYHKQLCDIAAEPGSDQNSSIRELILYLEGLIKFADESIKMGRSHDEVISRRIIAMVNLAGQLSHFPQFRTLSIQILEASWQRMITFGRVRENAPDTYLPPNYRRETVMDSLIGASAQSPYLHQIGIRILEDLRTYGIDSSSYEDIPQRGILGKLLTNRLSALARRKENALGYPIAGGKVDSGIAGAMSTKVHYLLQLADGFAGDDMKLAESALQECLRLVKQFGRYSDGFEYCVPLASLPNILKHPSLRDIFFEILEMLPDDNSRYLHLNRIVYKWAKEGNVESLGLLERIGRRNADATSYESVELLINIVFAKDRFDADKARRLERIIMKYPFDCERRVQLLANIGERSYRMGESQMAGHFYNEAWNAARKTEYPVLTRLKHLVPIMRYTGIASPQSYEDILREAEEVAMKSCPWNLIIVARAHAFNREYDMAERCVESISKEVIVSGDFIEGAQLDHRYEVIIEPAAINGDYDVVERLASKTNGRIESCLKNAAVRLVGKGSYAEAAKLCGFMLEKGYKDSYKCAGHFAPSAVLNIAEFILQTDPTQIEPARRCLEAGFKGAQWQTDISYIIRILSEYPYIDPNNEFLRKLHEFVFAEHFKISDKDQLSILRMWRERISAKAAPIVFDEQRRRALPQISPAAPAQDAATKNASSGATVINGISIRLNGSTLDEKTLGSIADSVEEVYKELRGAYGICYLVSARLQKSIEKRFPGKSIGVLGSTNIEKKRSDLKYPVGWKPALDYPNHFVTCIKLSDTNYVVIDANAQDYTKGTATTVDVDIFTAASFSELTARLCLYYGGLSWKFYDMEPGVEMNMIGIDKSSSSSTKLGLLEDGGHEIAMQPDTGRDYVGTADPQPAAPAQDVTADRKPINAAKNMDVYIDRKESVLRSMLGEGKPNTLLRVPVEAIELIGKDNVEAFLETFQKAPNGYVELYYMSGIGEVSEAVYGKYGLIKKKLPDDLKDPANRKRTNTVTLFAALKDYKDKLDEAFIRMRLGSFDMNPKNTIIVPIGIQHDQAGLIRSSILGLEIMDVARRLKADPALAIDQSFKDDVQARVLQDLLVLYNIDDIKDLGPDDIITLASGTNIVRIINSLKKLIDLLPIEPIKPEELRQIYEHAKAVITAA